mmetsp:Transcript_130063/g.324226  ORF Transcript_130063/g.324226 Transcript_130063/m.324226 type:complete len:140 (-) Transcript_130063:329-748(-)
MHLRMAMRRWRASWWQPVPRAVLRLLGLAQPLRQGSGKITGADQQCVLDSQWRTGTISMEAYAFFQRGDFGPLLSNDNGGTTRRRYLAYDLQVDALIRLSKSSRPGNFPMEVGTRGGAQSLSPASRSIGLGSGPLHKSC